ncbi:MAG: XRE family transcriptional regulator [Desulfomonile sp.]|jgi:quercetin dioxygenase-like cupin family protein|nr:XRE family transcriptional regulator [Deltaproteobacteria bacterium]
MAKKSDRVLGVGDRIREMRKKLNVDLNQLSEKTGYAADYLKEIEEGTIAPPVGALIQISRALAIDSATLLAEEKKIERRKSYRKRTKAYSYKSLTPDAEDKHLWAYLITLDPKKAHDMVEYKHEGEEFVYVLEGRVEIQVGQEPNILKRGSSLHFNSGTAHNLRNLSSKISQLLVVVYTP